MTTMTRPISQFAESRHHPVTTAAFVVVFWAAAAILVMAAHRTLDPYSPLGGAAAAIGAIVLAAFAYTRLVARQASLSHCLAVGTVWIVLAIVAELAVTERLGHGWYAVLGSPDHALLRNVFLFFWIFAPAFFAAREEP